ncbi:hypothetical protein [Thalassotalea castellviae]|uniref:Uncharacterized protein n=1 Tax=Thalassotalea castellviae TaxID=3075612 RepID=A0ABU3A0P5_9GAMM|nr:hypothetical protein [Thalassotalea sp. W431]MDT0602536.1 hypothetical protein [Thalassotalea sp. W431]
MTDKKWPEDYPVHIEIPPKNAKEINEKLYRLVENDVPEMSDFLASYKDPLQKHLVRFEKFKNNPHFYGASFFKTSEPAQHLIDGSPEKFHSKKVAVGPVEQKHGVASSGRGEHVSVWFCVDEYPKEFVLV